MAPARRPLQKLSASEGNQSRRRGREPKSLEEYSQLATLQVRYPPEYWKPRPKPTQTKPVQRIERSYSRERKIQVPLWLKYYRVPNEASNTGVNTGVKMRPPTLDETACFFQIPKSTIAYWTKPEISEWIIQSKLNSRMGATMFLCVWPEMERKLFEAFMERRKLGRAVRDSWFRRKALDLWKECYPQIAGACDLFVFSQGWFQGFLSRHRIVLGFVTNTAQALPTDYKQEILK